jgi:hypothetical protein
MDEGEAATALRSRVLGAGKGGHSGD